MKKLFGILILILSLAGCSSNDNDFINSLKSMTFNNGKTIETYVEEQMALGEFQLLNSKIIVTSFTYIYTLMSDEQVYEVFKNSNVKMPEKKEITWEVEGETKDGKVVVAYNDKILVKIQTVKNGDYIETDTGKIKTYSRANNQQLDDLMEEKRFLYELALRCGYGISQIQDTEINQDENTLYERFDVRKITKDTSGIFSYEYYPSGRVKFISDTLYDYNFNDESLIDGIQESLSELEKEVKKFDPTDKENLEYLTKIIDFSSEIEYKIIAEKLYKNNSAKEKKKLEKLEKRATKIFKLLDSKNPYLEGNS